MKAKKKCKECEKLKERIAILEAVAEAAKEILEPTEWNPYSHRAEDHLRAALEDSGCEMDRKCYDSLFGDQKECKCGHPYYRHFDTYDDMSPVGCKYCGCGVWEEPETVKKDEHAPEIMGED